MKEIRLKIAEFDLLREALANKDELSQLIRGCTRVVIYLNDAQKEAVQEAIGGELAALGVGSDGAINDRGVALDDLIGKFFID